jgi:hypothetical protein
MDAYTSDTGMAPSINAPGIGDYLTARTVILAHANIYRLYEREFKQQQQGRPASKSFLRQRINTFNERKIYLTLRRLISYIYIYIYIYIYTSLVAQRLII